ICPKALGEPPDHLPQTAVRAPQLEKDKWQQQPETPARSGWIEHRLWIERLVRVRLEQRKGMLEGQRAVLHARFPAQVAIGPAAHQIEDALFVQSRVGIETQVA